MFLLCVITSNFNLCLMNGDWGRGSFLVIEVIFILEEAQQLTTKDCKMKNEVTLDNISIIPKNKTLIKHLITLIICQKRKKKQMRIYDIHFLYAYKECLCPFLYYYLYFM